MGKRKLAVTAAAYDAATTVSRYSSRGVDAHVRGWNVGMRTSVIVRDDGILVFEVYTTHGSNDPRLDQLIATMSVCEDGTGRRLLQFGRV